MTTNPMAVMVAAALTLNAAASAHGQAAGSGAGHERVTTVAEPAGTHSDGESRYRLSWRRDGLIFGASALGMLVADAAISEHAKLTVHDLAAFSRHDVAWFDRSATRRYSTELIDLSEQVATPLAVAPLALLLDARMRADWQAIGVMYIQTTLLAGATSSLAKETLSRHRPYVYNTDLSDEQRIEREPGKSFFSSAATYAFARAVLLSSVFSEHHPDSPLTPIVWGVSLSAAGTVGYLRYASGIHYPSDIVVGALVGGAIGYAVPRLHRSTPQSLSVAPTAGAHGLGLAARITF